MAKTWSEQADEVVRHLATIGLGVVERVAKVTLTPLPPPPMLNRGMVVVVVTKCGGAAPSAE
jgi:hypothetical protein